MGSRPELSLVLPTLNEAGNIGPLLEDLEAVLEGVPTEVILVDDGSSDGTVSEAQQAFEDLRVIERTETRGLGTAIVRGLAAAQGRYVAVMDADHQHPPEAVVRMHEAACVGHADLVVGTRYTAGGRDPGFSLPRRMLSRGAHAMAHLLLPEVRRHGLTDAMSGLFLVRRDRVDPDDLDPKGYKVLLEILEQADLDKVTEVGYTFQDRDAGRSKLGLDTMVAFLAHLVRLARGHRENRRVVQFALIGALGVLVNLGVLFGLTEGLGLHYMVSATIAVELSILHNFYLNDVITFRDLRHGRRWKRLLRFNLVSLVSLLVNLAALAFLTEVLGIFYLLSETAAIGVAFVLNYIGNRGWTYLQPTPKTQDDTEPASTPWYAFGWGGLPP